MECCTRLPARSKDSERKRRARPKPPRPIPTFTDFFTSRGELQMPTTLNKDEILEAIGNMSVFELAELIDAFKSKFNVTIAAAAPAAAAPAGGGGAAAAAPAAEEQTEFAVTLKDAGAK